MLRRLLIAISGLPLLIEIWLYATGANRGWIYSGIAKALPSFRDVYILTINSTCETPAYLFNRLGGCSNHFYGVNTQVFDYPVGIFLLGQALPRWLFANPSIVGAVLGTTLVICLLRSIELSTRGTFAAFISVSVLYTKPVRYLLERGNLDEITWILALMAGLIVAQASEAKIKSRFRMFLRNMLLSASIAVKGFTLPAASVELATLGRLKNRPHRVLMIILLLVFAASVTSVISISGGAGGYATSIQNMRGEIFGFSVGLDNASLATIKIVFALSGYLFTSRVTGKLDKYQIGLEQRGFDIGIYLIMLGSSAMSMFYILTVSANYKLVAVAIVLVGLNSVHSHFTRRIERSNRVSESLAMGAVFLILASSLLIGYRYYVPGLQFASQDLVDYMLHPYTFGVCASLGLWSTRMRINRSG